MSSYVVSMRSVVHLTTCAHTHRMAYRYPWNPETAMSFDRPCSRCIGTVLPPTTTEGASE